MGNLVRYGYLANIVLLFLFISNVEHTQNTKQNENYIDIIIMGVLHNFETGSIEKMKRGCCTVSGDKVMQSINTKRATYVV